MNKHIVVTISALLSAAVHAAPTPCLCNTAPVTSSVTSSGHHPSVTTGQKAKKAVDHSKKVSVAMLEAPKIQADLPVAPVATPASSEKNHSGVYLGIEGVTRGVNLGANGHDAGYHWPDQKRARGYGGRLSLGYRINDNVAVELGYMTGFSVLDASTTPSGVVSYDSRQRVSGGDASLMYHFTEYVPGVYVRGGASYMQSEGSSVKTNRMEYRQRRPANYVFPDKHDSHRQSGLGLVAGVGYEAAVTDHIGVNVGYTRYQGVAGNSHHAINLFSVGGKYHF